VKYAAIADWAQEQQYTVTFMCDQLGVARQGCYRWRSAGPCARERTDAELTAAIGEIHTELAGHPGVRRIWAELAARGVQVSPQRIWRLMRAAGLRGRHPRAWRKTTLAGQRPVDAPDLIGQDFTAEQPNTRWCDDITYVRTVEGWVYTATVIDLHSRKVVGYAVAEHLRTSLMGTQSQERGVSRFQDWGRWVMTVATPSVHRGPERIPRLRSACAGLIYRHVVMAGQVTSTQAQGPEPSM
jgi:putative transposase